MPSLRRKKSKSSDDASVGSASISSSASSRSSFKALKKKGTKSIKGFITGSSKKQKKRQSQIESSARALGLSVSSVPEGKSLSFNGTEEDTVYGIKLDKSTELDTPAGDADPALEEDATKATPPSSLPASESLRLVLLLLDPSSRRFELLQLEFDAKRAHVSDVLNQIPLTATEEALRKKDYSGLCNRSGTEMFKEGLLSECKYEDGVLIAIPDGLTSKDSAKLANPILGDPKVLATFQPSQEEVAPPLIKETKEIESPGANPAEDIAETPKNLERSVPIIESKEGMETSEAPFISRFFLLVFLIAALFPLGVILQKRHTAPLSPGDILSPGEWKSTCGVLSLLPTEWTGCRQSILDMSPDGVLTFREDSEPVWSLAGGVCEADAEECTHGAVVTESGGVLLGGNDISKYVPDLLYSWPFQKKIEISEEN